MHPFAPAAHVPWSVAQNLLMTAWRKRATADRWPAWTATLVDTLARLMWYRSHTLQTSTVYAWSSETYLATRCSVTRETVARWLPRLAQAGFFHVTNRRAVNGRWQTNLYRLGSYATALLKLKSTAGRRPATDSAPGLASSSALSPASVTPSSHGATFQSLVNRWLARGTSTNPTGDPPDETET
jgi:hypothetical protein